MQPTNQPKTPASLLDKVKHKVDDAIEAGKHASENASEFVATVDTFHQLSPFSNFIVHYFPPIAIVFNGFALMFDALDVSVKRRIDRFITSKIGLGLIIVAAGILALTLPIISVAMFAVIVTAGLGKQIIDFVKYLNEDKIHEPKVDFENKLGLTAGGVAWAGALLLIIGGPFFPPLAIAGFGLLALSIAVPAANKFWQWLHRTDEANVAVEVVQEHDFDSTARASFEIAEAEAKEAHESMDEPNVKHKAIEEIQHGLESMEEETQEVEPAPIITESLVMPLHSLKPVKKELGKDEVDDDDDEGAGGEVSDDNTPKSHF